MTKVEAIEHVLQDNGGAASWNYIYENIERYYPAAKVSKEWEAGIRGVLYRDLNKRFKRVGLSIYALIDYKEEAAPIENRVRMHSFMEGICLELGNFKKFDTYTADPSAIYRDNIRLQNVATTINLPQFTYPEILQETKRIDVLWFNQKSFQFPQYAIEIVDSIGTLNGAFNRCLQLQNFRTKFIIVAPEKHHEKYKQTLSLEAYQREQHRFKFLNYDKLQEIYQNTAQLHKLEEDIF